MGTSGRPGAPAKSLTIVSLDTVRQSVHMLSIPPNLWVTVPGFGQATVAAAYADGGPKLALLTVESMTHVAIPYFVTVSSGSLRALIDALGGVQVGPGNRQRGGARLLRIAPLSGAAALTYLRGSDQGGPRGDALARERRLIVALTSQALAPQNFFRIPTLVSTLGGSFSTNFPYDQVPSLAHAMAAVPPSHIAGMALEQSNGAVANGLGAGRGVLIPDWFHIRRVAASLFPQPDLTVSSGVAVLNGTNVTGQAAALADWLQQGGVHVSEIGTAASPSPRTQICLSVSASPSQRRLAVELAALLQAPVVTRSVSPSGSRIVVLIGHDYQDIAQQ
jgi:LCP family protein required for cell wall assembly